MTGEQFFLRCIFPCVEGIFYGGLLDETRYAKFIKLLEANDANGEPDEGFLNRLLTDCVPDLAKEWGEYKERNNVQGIPLEAAVDFWWNHHDARGTCRLYRAVVVNSIPPKLARVSRDGEQPPKQFLVVNPCKLPLVKGQVVHLHMRAIVAAEPEV